MSLERKDAETHAAPLPAGGPPLDAPIDLCWRRWWYALLADGRAALVGESGAWTLDQPMGRLRGQGQAEDVEAAKRDALGADSQRATWRLLLRAHIAVLVDLSITEEPGPRYAWRITAYATTCIASGEADTLEAAREACERARQERLVITAHMRQRHETLQDKEAPPRFGKPPGPRPTSPAFGKLLRRLRMAVGMGFPELAKQLGVPMSYLFDVEQGKREPLLSEEIDDAARILNADVETLRAVARKCRRPRASTGAAGGGAA
ncbi:MAG: helix-turn-helix transcriptional regulator [Polyangia bacterium]